VTGHAGGVITVNAVEADTPARKRIRHTLNEPYRTLLGHFRHEIAHYYWHRLVEQGPELEQFRLMFGDEQADYQAALEEHYAREGTTGWQEQFISADAASHPWEDL